MLPLLPLVDKPIDFVSGSRARVQLALVQMLLTCIPSQIIGDSDPKVLYTLDIFEGPDLLKSLFAEYFIRYLHQN